MALGDPGYPSYRQILKALSLTPVGIPARPENRLPARARGPARGTSRASSSPRPRTPPAPCSTAPRSAALIEAAKARGAAFISDEIYHGIEYGRKAVSALQITDDVYVINSFSKYFSMTGWRIGWMVVPEAHVRTVERLAQNMFICPPHASQVAALAAMDCPRNWSATSPSTRENRRLMLEGLPKAGFTTFAPPDGAFYVYADVSDLTDDSLAFARRILDEAGVAVTPGLDFDPVRGRHTLRFSYARATADIREGLDRLAHSPPASDGSRAPRNGV